MATDSVEDVRENDQEVTDHNLKVMVRSSHPAISLSLES